MSRPESSTEATAVAGMEEGAGIRVELAVTQPSCCPVAEVTADCEETAGSIAKSSLPDGDRTIVEFTLPAASSPSREDLEEVFTSAEQTRYRCTQEATGDCLCEFVERRAGPVSDHHAVEGTVHVTFYVADLETVRGIISAAREAFGSVRLDHLSQSTPLHGEDPVVLDRACLTERQHEVLQTAHEMGYFGYPKRANACDVADELDIATSTFSEHLGAAQSKLLTAILEEC